MINWRRNLSILEPDKKKIASLLGLAAKSRNLVSGEYMTETAVKNGSARLVIVSEEASANTKKLFSNKWLPPKAPTTKLDLKPGTT